MIQLEGALTAFLSQQKGTNLQMITPQIFHSQRQDYISHFHPDSCQWLFNEIDSWLSENNETDDDNSSRLLWIYGDAGVGKSTFATILSLKLKEKGSLLGTYFCQHIYDTSKESIIEIIRSLAVQCSENLSSSSAKEFFDYGICEWDKASVNEEFPSYDLFKCLLSTPFQEYTNSLQLDLHQDPSFCRELSPPPPPSPLPLPPPSPSPPPPPPRRHCLSPKLFVIDAVDESSDKQQLLQLISSMVQDLPSWVKIVIMSRYESDIMNSLRMIRPKEISIDRLGSRHLEDLHLFVEHHLRGGGVVNDDELYHAIDFIVKHSQGSFLYVTSVIEEIKKKTLRGKWYLCDFETYFPSGLMEWYRASFMRMKAHDPNSFAEVIFQVVKLIICSKSPMTLRDVTMILNLDLTIIEQQELINQLHQLFPLRPVDHPSHFHPSHSHPSHSHPSHVFVPFHKTLSDWLTDYNTSGSISLNDEEGRDDFFISLEEGNQMILDSFQTLINSNEDKMSRRPVSGGYFSRHAFDHWTQCDHTADTFSMKRLFKLKQVCKKKNTNQSSSLIPRSCPDRLLVVYLSYQTSSGWSVKEMVSFV
jgi:hypothetical protein